MNKTDAITPSTDLGNLEGSADIESPNMSNIGTFDRMEPTLCFALTIMCLRLFRYERDDS